MKLTHIVPCVCMRARRAANSLTAYYDKILEPLGITTPQFSILINLSTLEKATMTELSNLVKLDKSTLTRNIAVLEKNGFVTTEQGKNKREICVLLTSAGINKIEVGYPIWLKAQDDIINLLGGEKKALEFIKTLNMLQKLN